MTQINPSVAVIPSMPRVAATGQVLNKSSHELQQSIITFLDDFDDRSTQVFGAELPKLARGIDLLTDGVAGAANAFTMMGMMAGIALEAAGDKKVRDTLGNQLYDAFIENPDDTVRQLIAHAQTELDKDAESAIAYFLGGIFGAFGMVKIMGLVMPCESAAAGHILKGVHDGAMYAMPLMPEYSMAPYMTHDHRHGHAHHGDP